MSRTKIPDTVWVDILNRLVLRPKLRAAARAAGISEASLFLKLRQSDENPDAHQIEWLERTDSFSNHVRAAKKIFLLDLDRAALELAMVGHSTPKYFQGAPVWVVDEQVAGDARDLDELDWISKYGARRRDDHFARTPDGKLVQAEDTSPPNPMLLNKVLASYLPGIYGEKVEHTHNVQGRVWIEGSVPPQAQLPHGDAGDAFGLTTPAEQQQRPINTLALPHPCATTGDFDRKFRRKLLRPVTLFWDAEGKLLPPLPDDVVVAGTEQARAFEDAGITVTLVRAEELLAEDYENDFLHALAPAWKPKPKPKSAPTPGEVNDLARQAAQKSADKTTASLYEPQEKIGYGNPPPGGRRVVS